MFSLDFWTYKKKVTGWSDSDGGPDHPVLLHIHIIDMQKMYFLKMAKNYLSRHFR